jgi:hypothetical protein
MGRAAGTAGQASWGELCPRRRCAWKEEDGRVTILRPRFGFGRVGGFIERRFRPRPFRVHLDEIGSFVWKRCDGATRVSTIAEALVGEFGDRIDPVEERLVLFLQHLVRGRFATVDPAP